MVLNWMPELDDELHAALQQQFLLLGDCGGEMRVARSPASTSPDCTDDDHRDLDQHTNTRTQQLTQKKRSRQARTSTYYVRKEEMATLQGEIQRLQAQLAFLNSDNGILSSPHPVAPRQLAQIRQSLLHKQAENETLWNAVRDQQLVLASVQAALGGQLNMMQFSLPFASHIRLGTDWNERHASLLAMKDEKIRDGRCYMAERTRFLDPCSACSDTKHFTSPNGNMCKLALEVVPFEGVTNVKLVFEALLFYLFNMEISVTEILGDLTVRVGEGVQRQGISQNRLISNAYGDVQIEFNSVVFCGYMESDAGEVGVIVANFVSEDELYPYSPESRLRYDIVATITVQLESAYSVTGATDMSDDIKQGAKAVVLKRVAQSTFHRTDLPIPPHIMKELQRRAESWGDAMLETVSNIVYAQSSNTLQSWPS